MRAALMLLFVTACAVHEGSPPPAWQPGDAPLEVSTTDALWPHVSAACAGWAAIGLECVRGDSTALTVSDDLDPGDWAGARTHAHADGFAIRIGAFALEHDAVHTLTHELGHALQGVPQIPELLDRDQHILPEIGTSIMSARSNASVTDVDVDVLHVVWASL